jgi:hypothetical protein
MRVDAGQYLQADAGGRPRMMKERVIYERGVKGIILR